MIFAKILKGYVAQQQRLSQSDAFLDFAEQQTPAGVKARQRAAEKRREKAKEKALQERDDLFLLWRRWRHERVETLLAGPHGAKAQALLAFLQTMSLDDGPQLIELVRAGDWHHADPDTRFEILSLINTALTALREQHGLPLFDDALPDEEPTAFLIIREMFRER
jgi:muconolactone delta-isomerase